MNTYEKTGGQGSSVTAHPRILLQVIGQVPRKEKPRLATQPNSRDCVSRSVSVDGCGRPSRERQLRLGRKLNVLLSCRRCAGGSCARASCRSDRCAFAAASQRSNYGAAGCAAADEPGIALALTAQ